MHNEEVRVFVRIQAGLTIVNILTIVMCGAVLQLISNIKIRLFRSKLLKFMVPNDKKALHVK